MTDAEWPKVDDVVALPCVVRKVRADEPGWLLLAREDQHDRPVEAHASAVAPWRSAEEMRAADAVIEAARRILNEIDSQRPDVLHNGAIQSVRDDDVLAPMLAEARAALAAYNRAREGAAQ